jgi:hypothetical protein
MLINNKNILFFLIFFFQFILFNSCSKKEDRNLSKDQFIEIYTDIIFLSSDNKITDPERKLKIDSLFTAHRTTAAAFKNTINDFNKDPEEWKDIYKEVLNKLEKKKEKVR